MPYVFGLPDNIERSLQRTLSAAVLVQLRKLSAVAAESKGFEREKWRAQLGPLLETCRSMAVSGEATAAHVEVTRTLVARVIVSQKCLYAAPYTCRTQHT